MDKVHCNIIQDLLPLYADNVVSPESKEMVENHLSHCTECQEVLDEIKRSVHIPDLSDTTMLRKLKRKQQFKSLVSALLIVFLFYVLIGSPLIAYIRDASIEYGAEDCIVSMSEAGLPIIQMSDRAKGANIYYLYEVDSDQQTTVYICIDSNRHSFFYDLMTKVCKMDFSADGIYVTPTLGISAEAQNYSNFPSVKELRLDETVVAVYYLPITSEQQRDFYQNYIIPFKNGDNISALLTYEVPEVGPKVLLWGKE